MNLTSILCHCTIILPMLFQKKNYFTHVTFLKKIILPMLLTKIYFNNKLNDVLSRQLINMKIYEFSYSLIDVATHH